MARRVCVSGVTGLVGAQIVKDLLARGYTVHGTARNIADPARLAHITRLPGARDRFVAFQADLLTPGAFNLALEGCSAAIHCASPYVTDTVADPQRMIVDPAVKGTQSFLESCALAGSVDTVVVTSSVAAISDHGDPGKVFSEDDWNTTSSVSRMPYFYSKAAAERAAWEFADAHPAIRLVVVNPFIVIGPSLVPSLNASHKLLKSVVEGGFPGVLDLKWTFVDVRDVSKAHILAMEKETASGRYVCAACETPLHMADVVDIMVAKGFSPRQMNLSSGIMTGLVKTLSSFSSEANVTYIHNHIGKPLIATNDKIKHDLGMEFMDSAESVADTLEDMVKHGHLNDPRKNS